MRAHPGNGELAVAADAPSENFGPTSPAEPMKIRLNLGAGSIPVEGFVPVDRKMGGEVFPIAVPTGSGDEKWSPPDNSVDEIRASHLLEHFSHRKTVEVLTEWVRVLKPGGKIRIAVPDFEFCAIAQMQKRYDMPIEGYVYGGQNDDDDFHKAAFTDESLRYLMHSVGIERIRPWKSEVKDCAALPVSLNLEGFKAFPFAPLPAKTAVCINSMPRLSFTDNWACAFRSFVPLGIDLQQARGVFWDQALSEGIRGMLPGVKYIYTTDYDSAYSWEQVRELYRLMEENPAADAICSLEVRQHSDSALMVLKDAAGKYREKIELSELNQDLVPIDSGHFGLTIMRVASFAGLPKPWFRSEPDENGDWGEKRIDSDVAFWRQWCASGRTLFVAPHVVIGHGQFNFVWLDRNMKPFYQMPSDFNANGMPHQVMR